MKLTIYDQDTEHMLACNCRAAAFSLSGAEQH